MFASLGGCSEGEPPITTAAVTDSNEGKSPDDECGFLVGVVGGAVLGTPGVMVSTTPSAAGSFECGAGSGIAARFGGEVPAEAEHVCPAA